VTFGVLPSQIHEETWIIWHVCVDDSFARCASKNTGIFIIAPIVVFVVSRWEKCLPILWAMRLFAIGLCQVFIRVSANQQFQQHNLGEEQDP
jgi:hypothetical protein